MKWKLKFVHKRRTIVLSGSDIGNVSTSENENDLKYRKCPLFETGTTEYYILENCELMH